MIAMAKLSKQETKLVFDSDKTTQKNAAKVFFTLLKGTTPILEIELWLHQEIRTLWRRRVNVPVERQRHSICGSLWTALSEVEREEQVQFCCVIRFKETTPWSTTRHNTG